MTRSCAIVKDLRQDFPLGTIDVTCVTVTMMQRNGFVTKMKYFRNNSSHLHRSYSSSPQAVKRSLTKLLDVGVLQNIFSENQ